MSIRIEHLTKTIGHQTILNDLTLTIGSNEVVGLLGPNGAGKSSLMKVLTGLWRYDKGKVVVLGHDMSTDARAVSSRIGYLPENNPLYPSMYIAEYLSLMARLYRLDRRRAKERIEQLIGMVGLTDELSKPIGALSKGYKQRVGLAQALLTDPELLILDEPTTGLDPNQLEDIRALIRTLGDQRTIILSTHILQEVEAMCNRVVIINKGEISEDTTDLSSLTTLFQERTGRATDK